MAEKFIAGPSPNIAFTDDKIGRMKKEVLYMSDEEVDKKIYLKPRSPGQYRFPAAPLRRPSPEPCGYGRNHRTS